jgi:hypothetical protein
MDVAVHDSLTRCLAAVRAHIEALNRLVLSEHVRSDLIEKQVDRTPLWVVEIAGPVRSPEHLQVVVR